MTKADWDHLFRQSLDALNKGAIAAAETGCRALLDQRPDDPAAHQLMAAIRLAAQDPIAAERSLQIALTAHPDHVPTLVLAGRAARMAGDLDLAAFRFRRAAGLDPTRSDAAFAACTALIAKGGVNVSPLLHQLKARFPDHANGWAEVAEAFDAKGQLSLALAASEMAGPSAAAAQKRGDLLHRLGRFAEASVQLKQAVALDPRLVAGWFKLGLALQDMRDRAGSAEAYRRALALRPDLAEAWTNLGIVLQDGGDLTAAKQAYGRALLLRPEGFGRIAQALTTAPAGELWLDLDALRDHLLDDGRRSLARLSR